MFCKKTYFQLFFLKKNRGLITGEFNNQKTALQRGTPWTAPKTLFFLKILLIKLAFPGARKKNIFSKTGFVSKYYKNQCFSQKIANALTKINMFYKKQRMPLLKSLFLQKIANALAKINMFCKKQRMPLLKSIFFAKNRECPY